MSPRSRIVAGVLLGATSCTPAPPRALGGLEESRAPAAPDGGSPVADFARTDPAAPDCARVTRGVDGRTEEIGIDGWELLVVFAAPCRAPSGKPAGSRPRAMDSLALRFREAMKLDEG